MNQLYWMSISHKRRADNKIWDQIWTKLLRKGKPFYSNQVFYDGSEQQEHPRSSGERRRSRWDRQPEGGGEIGEGDKIGYQRRKTRWAGDDPQLNLVRLPDFMKDFWNTTWLSPIKVAVRLMELNNKLPNSNLRYNLTIASCSSCYEYR